MDMKLDPADKNFAQVMMAKKQVMASMMTAGVRVDGASMRSQNSDALGGVIDELKIARNRRQREERTQRLLAEGKL